MFHFFTATSCHLKKKKKYLMICLFSVDVYQWGWGVSSQIKPGTGNQVNLQRWSKKHTSFFFFSFFKTVNWIWEAVLPKSFQEFTNFHKCSFYLKIWVDCTVHPEICIASWKEKNLPTGLFKRHMLFDTVNWQRVEKWGQGTIKSRGG